MERREIIERRLFCQGLSATRFSNAAEVVEHFGAIQAQDYAMALWAIGARLGEPALSLIEESVASAEIVRTHILRPTWHFVNRRDIRWMMKLSAPSVRKATQYVDRKEGLTEELFSMCWKVIERCFRDVSDLTKTDIMSCLASEGIDVGNLLATQIIIRAELELLVCNGSKKGTYALFDERVPSTGETPREEAVARLAGIFFKSRGPATVNDFAWWSGLSMNDARFGVAALGKDLESFTFEGLRFHCFASELGESVADLAALLPCYDEYTVGYSTGRAVALPRDLDASMIGNGISKPIIVAGGEIVGTWRRGTKNSSVDIKMLGREVEVLGENINLCVAKFEKFRVT